MTTYHVLNTHDWLYARFMESALPARHGAAPTPADADIVIYLEPPWFDDRRPRFHRALAPHAVRRLFVFAQSDGALTWAPGIYASLPASRRGSLWNGGFYVYQRHYGQGQLGVHLDACYARAVDPDLLWSFVGSVDTCPRLRQAIVDLGDGRGLARDSRRWNEIVRWNWRPDSPLHDEAQSIFSTYADSLARSKFVVCPRGVGPGSIRVFEAMRMGRCPVIISDQWTPPSFVGWDQCAVRVRQADARHLPALLREREGDAGAMGAAARTAWERLYSPPMLLTTLVESCVELAERCPTSRQRAASAARAATTREGLRRARQAVARTGGMFRRATDVPDHGRTVAKGVAGTNANSGRAS